MKTKRKNKANIHRSILNKRQQEKRKDYDDLFLIIIHLFESIQKSLFTYLLTYFFSGSISVCGEKENGYWTVLHYRYQSKQKSQTELEQISILFTLVQVSEEIIDR